MSIVVTGATGQLGTLVVSSLLARGVAPTDIVTAGRDTEKLSKLEGLGVRTVQIDLADGSGLDEAFADADAVLLVSGNEPGNRVALHRNAVDAARRAGISRLVYTSAPHADTTTLILAPEHKETEDLIIASGVPFTFLRNGWYTENYAGTFAQARETGEIVQSVGDGRVASASREDFADAAAVALLAESPDNQIYELTGDVAWSFDDLAAVFSEVLGRKVTNATLTPDEHRARLIGGGLDEGTAGFIVGLDGNIRDGLLAETSGDLSGLIGRPTTPLKETVRQMV